MLHFCSTKTALVLNCHALFTLQRWEFHSDGISTVMNKLYKVIILTLAIVVTKNCLNVVITKEVNNIMQSCTQIPYTH